MSLVWWMLVHEARIQSRSYRFRILATLYLALTIAAPVAIHLNEAGFARTFGPGLWGAVVESSLPMFSVLFAWVIAGDAILREQDENSFFVVSLGVGTNAAYLATRWFAVTVIVLVVSWVPLLVTIAIGMSSGGGAETASFVLARWIASVVPLVMMSTALSMGLSTIVGSAIGGTLIALLGGMVALSILQSLLARISRMIDGPLDWLRFERPFEMLAMLVNRWSPPKPTYTDTPLDWRIYLELAIPRGLVVVSLSSFALVAATAFLRRSRPNHRVWRIRENHPIRTYLGALRSMIERLTPDAGLLAAERISIAGAALLVLFSFVAIHRMDGRWRQLARERAASERGEWPGTDRADLVVETISIDGELDPVEGLDVRVVLSVLNRGSAPASRLVAELNPALALASVDPSGLTVERRWNRVEMRLATPVEAGGRVELALRLAGVPSELVFEGFREGEFASWFEQVEASTSEFYIPDFSRSIRERHISSRRVDLIGASLFPIPRHMPWKGSDQSVQMAEVVVGLTTPEGLMLATSCGDLSVNEGDLMRLQSRCREEIHSFSIVGGQWISSNIGEDAALACLDRHREHGDRKARALVDAFVEARNRWPDLERRGRTIIAEVPRTQEFDAAAWIRVRDNKVDDEPTIDGSIVRVSEDWLMGRQDPNPGKLMVTLRAQSLLARRAVDPKQAYFFRHFYGALASADLGYSRDNGAVLGQSERVNFGLLENMTWDAVWDIRLPAIMEALRQRVGTKVLLESVEEFLSARGEGPARAGELFDILERRSGQPLGRFFADFVVAGKLPKLQLADVAFVRQREGWAVDGAVTNEGEGQAICEVVLRTDVSTFKANVEVEGDSRADFHFEVPHRPVKVELDPDRKCFRWEPKTTVREVVNEAGRS